jgi:ribosomal protein S27E
MKFDVSDSGFNKYTISKKECKTCGHKQLVFKEDRVICSHCGNYIYKDNATEFKYKLKINQIKEKKK